MSSVNLVNFNGIDRKKNYLISSPAKKDTQIYFNPQFQCCGLLEGGLESLLCTS